MLAGQPTSTTTLATNTTPALSDAALRSSGRRRGLSQLHNHLIHIHHPTHDSAAAAAASSLPTRPRVGRAQTSPTPAISPASPLPEQHPDADPASRPYTSADQENEPPARSPPRRRPRMLPIVNTQPFFEARGSRSAEPTPAAELASFLATNTPAAVSASQSQPAGSLPSIQFIPASDPTRARPSLDFRRITRTLPSSSSVIRVGRYSERDSAADPSPSAPSDAPIGFKSKVVSRRHCEFSFSAGQWYIKDVKSSSGTFLNHIRLSQPGIESRPFPINDGDTVQLGIDFKGGEEMIFRCVKIRIETNRGWQRGLNKFNKTTHKQLQALARGRRKDSDTASKHSTDCTICLNSIAPCQALFVAPCSHTWHFKCIRQILEQSVSGQFLCPNCRALADLDADVDEEDLEDFEDYEDGEEFAMLESEGQHRSSEEDQMGDEAGSGSGEDDVDGESSHESSNIEASARAERVQTRLAGFNQPQALSLDDAINRIGLGDLEAYNTSPTNTTLPTLSVSSPRPIRGSSTANGESLSRVRTNTTNTAGSELSDGLSELGSLGPSSPGRNALEGLSREGPMTPRNTAGPFVFDGAADASNGQAVHRSSDEVQRR